MNQLKFFVIALAFVSVASQARSLHPDTFKSEVAPVLSEIDVTVVSNKGEVAKSNRHHPYSEFLIAIPVTVNPGSVCTAFAGQQTTVENGKLQVIRMLGASDPMNDVCIQIMPEPVKTQLTVSMKVLTGGFVPANPIQRQVVQIMPLGLHEVTLDMGNNSVTVRPLVRHHR